MTNVTLLDGWLRRDRWVVALCLAAIVVISWLYILSGAGMDMSMPGMVMAPAAWSPTTGLLMFAMWWVMMIAMMVPSAAPTILLYSTIQRKKDVASEPSMAVALFLAGYLAVWAAFSVIATGLQWGLESLGLMAMDMRLSRSLLGGSVLVAAGLYQFTPIKSACLRHCQSPILFLSSNWKPGLAGAFRMGAHHGAYCLGCCAVLMGVLFVGGIMNLLWIAGLTVYVAIEKLVSGTVWPPRIIGMALSLAGALMLIGVVG